MQIKKARTKRGESQKNNYRDKTIFIIDDDEIVLDLVTKHLLAAGFEEKRIHGFTSPTEALEIIRFVEPGLIITDIHMPALSGDCMAKLIQWPEFNSAPVVAITADAGFCIENLPIQSGISKVVYKPIDSRDLISSVMSVLETEDRQLEARANEKREKKESSTKEIQHQEEKLRKSFGKKRNN